MDITANGVLVPIGVSVREDSSYLLSHEHMASLCGEAPAFSGPVSVQISHSTGNTHSFDVQTGGVTSVFGVDTVVLST